MMDLLINTVTVEQENLKSGSITSKNCFCKHTDTCMYVIPCSIPGSGRYAGEGYRLPTPVFLGFPGGSDSKESASNVRDWGSIFELGRFPGGGHSNPLQYLCPKNPHRQGSLVGYSPQGRKESDMTVTSRYSFWTFLV